MKIGLLFCFVAFSFLIASGDELRSRRRLSSNITVECIESECEGVGLEYSVGSGFDQISSKSEVADMKLSGSYTSCKSEKRRSSLVIAVEDIIEKELTHPLISLNGPMYDSEMLQMALDSPRLCTHAEDIVEKTLADPLITYKGDPFYEPKYIQMALGSPRLRKQAEDILEKFLDSPEKTIGGNPYYDPHLLQLASGVEKLRDKVKGIVKKLVKDPEVGPLGGVYRDPTILKIALSFERG
ncbi:MAG: hypothetical protein NT128_01030 [Proteobacteria bacterium]|nr:hypothetical protein [Pseudomonadota bacterium]